MDFGSEVVFVPLEEEKKSKADAGQEFATSTVDDNLEYFDAEEVTVKTMASVRQESNQKRFQNSNYNVAVNLNSNYYATVQNGDSCVCMVDLLDTAGQEVCFIHFFCNIEFLSFGVRNIVL